MGPDIGNLAVGSYQDKIEVTDAVSGTKALMFVFLEVRAPSLVLSRSSIAFNVDAGTVPGGIQSDLQISDEAPGLNAPRDFNWTITSGSPLVVVSPTTGSTATTTSIAVNINPVLLNGMLTGTVNTALSINYANSFGSSTAFVPISLTVRLPRAGSAYPYVLPAGGASTISLLGDDLQSTDLAALRINSSPVSGISGASVTRLSSQELSLSLPPLTSQPYEISFANALGLTRSSAGFSVTASPGSPGVGDMPSTGVRQKLIFDDSRNRLYAIDVDEGEIERYRWDGSSWITVGAIPLAGLSSANLLRDGQNMLAVTASGYYSISLSSELAPPALITSSAALALCGQSVSYPLSTASQAESGTLFGSISAGCGEAFEYDIIAGTAAVPRLAPGVSLPFGWRMDRATIETNANGRYVALGENSSSLGNYLVMDVRTRQIVSSIRYDGAFSSPDNIVYYKLVDLDRAGSKLLINNRIIRDRAGVTLGQLPVNSAARISGDGTRAFIYVHGLAGTGRVKVLDISTAVGLAGTYPQIGPDILVTSDMGASDPDYDYQNVSSFGAALSGNEHILFIAGSTRIVAVAIP